MPTTIALSGQELSPPQGESGPGDPAEQPASLTSGSFALKLIQRQTRRLGTLQPKVLADDDPEGLHQLRVSLRRLRTALSQFAPALVLPETISDARIARIARRTGLTRDLDVMGERLATRLLPLLPDRERDGLRPALKRLARDRHQAFEGLVQALTGAGYLKLLARLHKWQRKPTYSPLGQGQLQDWLLEWKLPIVAGLFFHTGWGAEDPSSEDLHDLRKRIKGVRYALENLEPFLAPSVLAWIAQLRQAQDDLGELHDLQVIQSLLLDRPRSRPHGGFPALEAEIGRQRSDHWHRWRELSAELCNASGRHNLQRELFALG
ncbi:CHAD domain-containing protein [Synechococcus sp. CCY 9618]|uniref:CHAD domain-containing protein n=1 Tax=Synechococcus sp. CCY 9618 TaxID=2815602 RepID=UPI001C229839|nr:CHAD domain-containing protein [Synechococcus sp. CCY 9618]